MSIFRSAVVGTDGTVDPGYLAVFWTMSVTVAMIPIAAALGFWLAFHSPEHASEIIMGTAAVVGALGAQCAAVIGAVGVFRMGDKSHANGNSRAPVVGDTYQAPSQ